jgi:uncharacterized protein (DUF2141 family)
VDLQDVPNNLLFTPLFQKNPRVDVKGKTITVNFQDTLEPNTTYILNFGNAIKDFHEGKVLPNFTYTFSTGPKLDSLELKGKVILAASGKTDTTLTVVLHRNLQDSAVMNQRPMYATKLDGNGNFRFRNLPVGTFAVYAIGDGGMSRQYRTLSQTFGFLDSPITTGKRDTTLVLYAYKQTQPSVSTTGGTARPGGKENRLTFTTNLTNEHQDLFSDLLIQFPLPLRSFDSAKLTLSSDSTFNRVPFTSKLDSNRKELRLRTSWKEGATYNLIMEKDFAQDTAGHKLLKTDTLFFTTQTVADYGNVRIRLKNLDTTKNPVLQFVQNEQVVFSAPIKSGTLTKSGFAPGDYELRILYDTNNNGKWDPGQFFGVKRQPELVKPLEQKFTVKAGSDNSLDR